jgi:hypothetical protein
MTTLAQLVNGAGWLRLSVVERARIIAACRPKDDKNSS